MKYTPQKLALTIRKIIENHPENWNQTTWYRYGYGITTVEIIRRELEEGTCGSTACVAGWAAILVSPPNATLVHGERVRIRKTDRYVRIIAQKALGLSNGEADWLFAAHRSKEEVMSALTAIENGFDWYSDIM